VECEIALTAFAAYRRLNLMEESLPRIGLVSLGSKAQGSAERRVCLLAKVLQKRGHKTVLFTGPNWPSELEADCPVVRLPGGSPMDFANQLDEADPAKHCDQLLSFEPVWECDFYRTRDGVYQAWMNRQKQFAGSSRGRGTSLPIAWEAEYLQLEQSLFNRDQERVILATSEQVRHEIRQYYGLASDRVQVFYDGLQEREWAPESKRQEVRKELGLKDKDLMVLADFDAGELGLTYAEAVGRRLRRKGVRLVVTGTAPPHWLGRNATFVGPVDDLSPYLRAADLFLCPTPYTEVSEPCLMACAHGLPVITSTANGYSEIMVHTQHGEAVEDPSDIASLSEAVLRWVAPEKRERLQPHIQRFSNTLRARRSIKEMARLMGNPSAGLVSEADPQPS